MKLGVSTFLKHLVKDSLPQNVLFWDTSLPASAIFLHPQSDQRKAAINFIDRLIKEKTYIAFSSILFDEFLHIVSLIELEKSQFSRKKAQAALTRKDRSIIEPHIADIQKNMVALNDILSKFTGNFKVVFPTEPGIVGKALELQCVYKLERADSIHIATMLYGAQRDIACFDRNDFGQVDGLNIWCKYK
ncbi:MAG: hypothetical protein V1890_08080 [Candidatus Zixiibacteriota bacterium]